MDDEIESARCIMVKRISIREVTQASARCSYMAACPGVYDLTIKGKALGDFSLTGNPDGSYNITMSSPVEIFVQHGRDEMKLWRKVDGMDGCKFLVVRRDGSIPKWPHFVMGARDPWAPAALRAYADAAEDGQADPDYVTSLRELANEFEIYRLQNGPGDPDAPPHRPDDPAVVQVMRDCAGGRIFITAAWDEAQVDREADKAKEKSHGEIQDG